MRVTKELVAVKLVTAIIRPSRLNEVRIVLTGLGVTGMTILEAKGSGQQEESTQIYRANEYRTDLLPLIQIEAVLDDLLAERAVDAIRATACSGRSGDGKIFVLRLDRVTRIRTGETGPVAL